MSSGLFIVFYVIVLFVLAALFLKGAELADRFLRVKGLEWLTLSAAGAALSAIGWVAYNQGRASFWQALLGTVLLASLPVLFSAWAATPDLLHAAFSWARQRLFR